MIHNRWHPDLEPVAEVAPGEEIRLETEEGLGGQLTPESTHADAGSLNLGLGHPLTGPVYVQGAEAGDALEIEFVSYESADFGTTAVIPGFGFLADLFPDPYLVKWEIDAGVARSAELPGVAVPEALFAGVAGVAPSRERLEAWRRREEALHAAGQLVADPMPETAVPAQAADGLRTIPPRELGGNLDVRQLVAGSRLWLPVDVAGALFSVGDLHFAQGDGEVCGTAIEVAGAVTLRFDLRKGGAPRFPLFETPARPGRRSFATTGIPIDAGMDLNAAAREALLAMVDHLEQTYGFERPAAYALCSVVVDLRVSEVVDVPNPVVSALLPLDVFEGSVG
ncbi:MAG TPA: acetamidase/formamidase family protein [Gaiellaceae bacterium]|nr:acetamidase/formamidase family protein [Gaiellaceae bacterium]